MIISPVEISVNTPKRDYLQEFVDKHHLEDPPQRQRIDERPPVWMVAPDWLEDAPVTTAAQDAPSVKKQALNALRMLDVIDMATIVPMEFWAVSANGQAQYRTRQTDYAVARAALRLFAERNKATIRISNLELAARVNCSDPTAGKAMRRLCELFRMVEPSDPDQKTPALYTLTQHPIFDVNHSTSNNCVDLDDPNTNHLNLRNSSTLNDLDIFSRALSALEMPEYLAREKIRNAARREIAQEPDPVVKERRLKADIAARRQLIKRRHAVFDALGRDAGRAVAWLEEYGSLRPGELAAIAHVSDSSCSRTLRKLRKAGLIDAGSELVTLVDGYAEKIALMDKSTPVTGSRRARWKRFLERRTDLLKQRIAAAEDDKARRYWENALENLLAEAPSNQQQARIDDWRKVAAMVADLPTEDARRQLEYAGWNAAEVSRILSYRPTVGTVGRGKP